MTPESVGLEKNSLVLGKHSGKHAYHKRIQDLGYGVLSDEKLEAFVQKFKILADEKKVVTDADIHAIIAEDARKVETSSWSLKKVQESAGNLLTPSTNTRVGPVAAVLTALSNIVKPPSSELNRLTVSNINN